MDFTDSLNSIFGVSEPLYLAIAGLVALLLAGALSSTVLEVARICREYAAPAPPRAMPKAEAKSAPAPRETEPPKVEITSLGHIAAQQLAQTLAAPPVDVVKDSLTDSMKAITSKYGLDWLTIASTDGLVIASTSSTPDEDAAVYSNIYLELFRTRPEPYLEVSNKDIHLLLVESCGEKVIGVARKAGAMTQGEAAAIRDDSRKIIEHFVLGGRKI